MGKTTGFLEFEREIEQYQPVENRIKGYKEFTIPLSEDKLKNQGARCMDCGIPFCHSGCPLGNLIPDFNDAVYKGKWQKAAEILHSTNNFPEFTGRLCPAPCEEACVLGINEDPVTIENIEKNIVEQAFDKGWIKPHPPKERTGKSVAVVGSGPAGLAAAQQLNRAGHAVTVYERDERPGGLLRYGIPDFKMEKHLIDRRVAQLEEEGVTFQYNVFIGVERDAKDLLDIYDAVALTGGSEHARDLQVPGRDLKGIEFAMDFLPQQNRRIGDESLGDVEEISANGKNVVVIGGGDTGSDCIGTSFRQGAISVTQLEIMPQPPESPDKGTTWPLWPNRLRTSSSQAEGAKRDWCVSTTKFSGKDGQLTTLHVTRLDEKLREIPGSEFAMPAELVLLAMGFVHPVHGGMLENLGVELDSRGNVAANADNYQTSTSKLFAAGDMRRGQSLVVWAIREGRQCARAIDEFLMKKSVLPR